MLASRIKKKMLLNYSFCGFFFFLCEMWPENLRSKRFLCFSLLCILWGRVVIYEYWTNPTTTVATVFEPHALCLPLNAKFFSIFNSRYLSIGEQHGRCIIILYNPTMTLNIWTALFACQNYGSVAVKTKSKTFRRDVIRIHSFIISLPFGKQYEYNYLKLKSIQLRIIDITARW